MVRTITFLVYPEFVLIDLSGPLEAFAHAGAMAGAAYHLRVASREGGAIRSACGLEVMTERLTPHASDTFIVVGSTTPKDGSELAGIVQVVHDHAARSRRLASVCTGAFILAEAGLLDHRAATTHWLYAPRLQALYPSLRVDGDRIYTQDGNVWTSAGMTAGIDMTLALIEDDLGKAIAQAVARMLVVYYRRPGGQQQFSSLLDLDPNSDRIRRSLSFIRENLGASLPVERLAEAARLSVRQFGRAFAASTGMTPAKAVERIRVEAARPMVEDGGRSFDEIARLTGFGDTDRMCQSFLRTLGHTPQELRRASRHIGGE